MKKIILIATAILLSCPGWAQQPAAGRKAFHLPVTYYQHLLQCDSATATKVLKIQEAYQLAIRKVYRDSTQAAGTKRKRHDLLDSVRVASLKSILTQEQLRPFNIVPPKTNPITLPTIPLGRRHKQ